jgi:tetratricopeptide (TPR) repeat protein
MRFLFVAVTLLSSQAFAAELTGKWEVQSMGADRAIVIEQKGQEIVAHRVMWPEFEGQRYKLEHLYRGTLKGNQIAGELLVKEPELKDFEVLRDFQGTIAANGSVTLDGMPLKRLDAPVVVAQAAPPPVAPAAPLAPSAPAKPAAVVQAAPPPAAPAAPAAPLAPSAPAKPAAVAQAAPPPAAAPAEPASAAAASASPSGSGLFKVPTNAMPTAAATLTKEGDKLQKNKQWAAALAKFQAAEAQGAGNAALWHRMGTCYLYLERYEDAKTQLRRAIKLDPQNPVLLRDYNRATMLSE